MDNSQKLISAAAGAFVAVCLGFTAYAYSTMPPTLPKLEDTKLEELTKEFKHRVNVNGDNYLNDEEISRMLKVCGFGEDELQGTLEFFIGRVHGTEITPTYYDNNPHLRKYQVPYNIAQGCLDKL